MDAKNTKTESELVKELNQGSGIAFNWLFNIYSNKIFHFAVSILKSKEEAEEVVQNTFLIIWDKRHTIDSNQSFKSFIFSIAYNVTMDVFRIKIKEKKYRDHVLLSATTLFDPEKSFASDDLYQSLVNIVEELPERRREIFKLRQLEGQSYKEISGRLNISVKTVENNINLAVRYIKGKLNKDIIIIIIGLFNVC